MSNILRNKLAIAVLGIVGIAFVAVLVGVATVSIAQADTYNFTRTLKLGMSGADVMDLQKMLNSSADTQVASTGAGSPGNETSYFGGLTKAAVIKWQNKYAASVLAPVGLSSGTGLFGPSSRGVANGTSVTTTTTTTSTAGCAAGAAFSATTGQACTSTTTTNAGCAPGAAFSSTTGQACSSTTTTTTTTTTSTTGGALSVAAGTQPANGLAVGGSARVPFTRVTFTAGSADTTVSGITVERVGPAVDAVFAGIVLLDEDGVQLGIAKTLNSNHQTTVGDPFVVKAGTSRTMTIAGNMASLATLAGYAGQVVALQVDAVNTNGTVSGSLPIVGAMNTINGSLTIGTAQMAVSSYDPNGAQTQNIGVTNYRVAGVRITAGSAEQVRVRSIRWNQTGSAGSNDLANVMTYVDGTAYPTTVSADGKYYTAVFGAGLVVDKGLSKDFYVQTDIIGTASAGRNVEFDIYKATDVAVSGETYGYGITATAPTTASADTGSQFTTGTPFFSGSVITVSAGSATSIQKSVSVPAQNIAVNVPNQVLGGFDVDIKGEPISVQSIPISIATSSAWGAASGCITNISLYGPNGNIVAGPVDEATTCTNPTSVTFTDTVTFPIGKGTYTLKGKIPSGVGNGSTVIVSTNPFTWSNITGQTTGNTIALVAATSNFAMNTMTVKAAALAITLSATPAASTIVAGSQNRTLANYVLDASQSGENVRFSSVSLKPAQVGGGITGLTTCQLWDGAIALNTGSNVVTTANPMTVTFDSSLEVAKGTVKTLTLKCNVASTATGTYQWGIVTSATNPTVTGVTSASTVTVNSASYGTINGQAMAISATGGTLVVSQHPSSPTYAVVAANSTGNVVGILNLRASNEAINLAKLGLALTGGTGDIGNVTVWDGSTQVGTASFTTSDSTATSTFRNAQGVDTPILIPKDTDKQLTIKSDFGSIGTNLPGTPGKLVKVDYQSAQGTGVDSGLTVEGSGSTSFAGARLQKTFPIITYSTTGGTASNGTNDLLVVNIQANSTGDVMMNKLTFSVSTTTVAGVASANLTFTGPNGNVSSTTPIATPADTPTSIVVYFDSNSNTNDRTIGAGTTKSYTLRLNSMSLTGTNSTGSISVGLLADTAYPAFSTGLTMGSTTASTTGAGAKLSGTEKIIWSPISTTSIANASSTYDDWTNGYGLGGCFATSGLGQNCTARTLAK